MIFHSILLYLRSSIVCYGVVLLHKTKTEILVISSLLLFLVSTCDKKAVEPGDQTPPAAITTLTVVDSTATSAVLRWQATGDDGTEGTASDYDLRYDTIYDILLNWDEAIVYPITSTPKPNTFWEFLEIKDLDSTKGYFFGLKASDEAGNWSALSNIVSVHIPDTIFPAAITDLLVTNIDTFSVTLSWTASGDDSTTGLATAYDIRYDTTALTELSWTQAEVINDLVVPLVSGFSETYTIDSLIPTTGYYFGIKVIDDAANISPISNIVSATTLYKDTSTIIWETTIGGASDELVSSIVLTSDKGFALAGGITDPGGTSDDYFAKIGSNGVLIWETRTGGTEPDYINDLLALSTGEVVAAGYTESFGSDGKDFYLVKLTDSGDLVWEKNIAGVVNEVAISIERAHDEGFIIGGNSGSIYIDNAASLLKVSSLGAIEWQRLYAIGDYCGSDPWSGPTGRGRTAIATQDGGYALSWAGSGPSICGHTGPGPPVEKTLLVKTSDNGTSEWTFSVGGLYSYFVAGPVIRVSTGGYLFAYQSGENYHYAKISNTGGEVWNLRDDRYNPGRLAGLIQLKSGNFMVALQTGSQIELIVLSSSGTVINSRIISQNNYGGGDLLVQAPDGNIIIAGWYYADDSNWNIRVLKIRNEY